MIVWKGRGILIALVTFAWLLALDWLTGEHFGDRKYYAQHGWPKLVGFWAGAATIWLMRGVLGVREPTTLSSPGGVESIGPSPRGRPVDEGELFFVKARYWPVILSVVGALFAVL
jgi:hypothetical protein